MSTALRWLCFLAFVGDLAIIKGTVYYFGYKAYYWNPRMNEVMEIQDFNLTGVKVAAYNQDSCVLNDDCLRMSELDN